MLTALGMTLVIATRGIDISVGAVVAMLIGGTMLTGGCGYVAGTLSGVLILGVIQALIAFDGTLSS